MIAVIRSVGERTESECARLLPCEAVVIHEKPFVSAVRRCFEIGIDSGEDWLLTVDADVLTHPGAVEALLEDAGDSFQCQGRVDDKLSGTVRDGGHRLYRIDFLPIALRMLRDAVRVETDVVLRMDAEGYPRRKSRVVCGKHDYEQWYRDLYRKGGQHAKKFRHEPWPHRWKASDDMDLQAAYAGWHGLPFYVPEKEPMC